MSKYDPLKAFLENTSPSVSEMTLSFKQIETILGNTLPPSARFHRAWWSNPSSPHDHPYARAWLAAGWKVESVDQDDEKVRFRRLPVGGKKTDRFVNKITAEPEEMAVGPKVDRLEVRLRNFIDHRLTAAVGPHYWKSTMPGDVIATVKQLITEQLSRHPYEDLSRFASGRRRLDFCDVSHYEKIILKNWAQFEESFRRKEEFQRHIAAYRVLRNCVQHNRQPSDIELQVGQAAITWLERVLDRYEQETFAPSEENEEEPTLTMMAGRSPATRQMETQKKVPAERYLSHKEFWAQLLERAKKKTSLHARCSPRTQGWLNTGAGKHGLVYRYVIRKDDAHVELRIRRDTFEESKHIFDLLQKNKATIEQAFGDRLEWLRRDDVGDGIRNSHIRHTMPSGGLRDRDRWPEIQDRMIDAMVRLERALKPEIQRLPR